MYVRGLRLHLRGRDKGMGLRVCIIATGEIAVIRCYDRVLITLFDIVALPLSDARAAGVGQYSSAHLLKNAHEVVSLNCGANLLRAGSNDETAIGLNSVFQRLPSDGSSARHVFIRGIGAASDEALRKLFRPVVLLYNIRKLRKWCCQVGRERAIDVWLQFTKIDFDHFVIQLAFFTSCSKEIDESAGSS